MAGFSVHTGRIAVLPEDHIDTDRIIPARFLSMVTKSGYGELLFHDVKGPDFPLDQPEAKGATILVPGLNFGCGSSREHAVWAIQQGGFVAVVAKKTEDAPGFSDIFRQNSANCGLLLIELEAADHDQLSALGSGAEVTVDLPNQTVLAGGKSFSFEINPATKSQILKGLDLVGTTLEFDAKIAEYEAAMSTYIPASVASR